MYFGLNTEFFPLSLSSAPFRYYVHAYVDAHSNLMHVLLFSVEICSAIKANSDCTSAFADLKWTSEGLEALKCVNK